MHSQSSRNINHHFKSKLLKCIHCWFSEVVNHYDINAKLLQSLLQIRCPPTIHRKDVYNIVLVKLSIILGMNNLASNTLGEASALISIEKVVRNQGHIVSTGVKLLSYVEDWHKVAQLGARDASNL